MKVVLREDVETLGRKGDLVDVADGYARNYLVPRGLAMKATKGVVSQAESMRRNREAREVRERKAAEELASASRRPRHGRRAPARAASSSARSRPPTSSPRCSGHRDRDRPAQAHARRADPRVGEVEVPVRLHADVDVVLGIAVVAELTRAARRRRRRPACCGMSRSRGAPSCDAGTDECHTPVVGWRVHMTYCAVPRPVENQAQDPQEKPGFWG